MPGDRRGANCAFEPNVQNLIKRVTHRALDSLETRLIARQATDKSLMQAALVNYLMDRVQSGERSETRLYEGAMAALAGPARTSRISVGALLG